MRQTEQTGGDHINWKVTEVENTEHDQLHWFFGGGKLGQGHKMDHPAEIVHQRQDDGEATGRKEGSNKAHRPHLHLKHPLLPPGIWKTGPEVNLGHTEDLPEGCDTP